MPRLPGELFDDDESFNDENDERAVWPGWRRTGHFGDWPSLPDSVVPRLPGDLFDDEDDGGGGVAGAAAAAVRQPAPPVRHNVGPHLHLQLC